MQCKKVKKNLAAYMDGEISEELHARITRHISGCTSCKMELKELQRILEAMAAVEEIPAPPPAMAQQILDRAAAAPVKKGKGQVERITFRPAPLRDRIFRQPGYIIAGLLCVVGLYLAFPHMRNITVPEQQEIRIAEKMELFDNLEVIRNLSLMQFQYGMYALCQSVQKH